MKFLDWLNAKWFRFVHGKNLVYNACWEDPRLDRIALRLTPRDTVLTITSAGCNALDYALQSPKHVYAVDMNPRQNALLELKLAGIRRLDFDEFFRWFGEGRHPDARSVYEKKLRSALPSPAQRYWDRHVRFFEAPRLRPSFYFHGTSGILARTANLYIDKIARVRDEVNALLDAPSVRVQRDIYHGGLRDRFWRPYLRWLLRRDATLAMAGVPKPQRIQVEKDYVGGIARFVEDCLESVFAELSLRDNYFWRVYLTGRYTRDCCPEYLKEENFQRLRDGLADRVTTHTDSILGFLRGFKGRISRFVLLDHMDWLAGPRRALLEQEWQAIVDRAAPQTRVIYRSGGLRADFVDEVAVQFGGARRRVGEILNYHRRLAAELHKIDRVHTYGSFHIADLAA
jgi:S-adenosylmethionine-diacylglycerol 3-amino-3-carboxypropyl transferase